LQAGCKTMSFETIIVSDIDEYRKEHVQLTKRYLQLKRELVSLVEAGDDEEIVKTASEFKKAYCEMKAMFWKIKEEEINIEIEKLKVDNPDSYESVKYYELCIKKFEYYDEYSKYHYMAKNQEYSYNRYIRPVVDNKIMGFHNCIDSRKRMIRVFGEE